MFTSLLKVTSFYKDFLLDYYRSYPDIGDLTFEEQYKHLMDQGYGYADYFPRYLEMKHGMRSTEIIHNANALQAAWARENNVHLSGDELLLEQIRSFRPEVLFIQDSANFSAAFVDRIREKTDPVPLLIGHVCAPYTKQNMEAFARYDLMLTCSEKFRMELSAKGIRAHLFPHAFEASLLQEISAEEAPSNDIIFIGSLLMRSEFHRTRIAYLEEILREGLPMTMIGVMDEDPWHLLKVKQMSYLLVRMAQGAGMENIIRNRSLRKIAQLKEMPLRVRYPEIIRNELQRGLVFGKAMLGELARHAVGFNLHGEVAGEYAANVRMFEVTGAGSLLVSDSKQNMADLFVPGKEVLTYESQEDCVHKLKWAIAHPEEAAEIARAGQQRTLKDHTVERRVEELWEIMKEEYLK